MKPENELLEAVKSDDQDKVLELLNAGVDYRDSKDAALREALFLDNHTIATMFFRKYIADGVRDEPWEIEKKLIESAELLRHWYPCTMLRTGPILEI